MEEKNNQKVPTENYMQSEDNMVNLLMRTIRRIWNIRLKLYKIAIVGAVVGVIIAFSLPKEYVVELSVAPESAGKADRGLASMAASFLGGSISSNGGDALNALLTPEIIHSTPFLLELLDMHVSNGVNIDTRLAEYLDSESMPWWNYVIAIPGKTIYGLKSLFFSKQVEKNDSDVQGSLLRLSSRQISHISTLRRRLLALIDKKTSIITISVTLQDPMITALVADSVVSKMQKYMINYKISKAKENLIYWEKMYVETKDTYYKAMKNFGEYVDSNANMVLQSSMVEKERLQHEMSLAYQVYTQVAQQLQMANAKVQESKTVFTILEPAVVPSAPSNMGILKMMITFSILFIFCTIGWEICLKDLLHSLKRNCLKL